MCSTEVNVPKQREQVDEETTPFYIREVDEGESGKDDISSKQVVPRQAVVIGQRGRAVAGGTRTSL